MSVLLTRDEEVKEAQKCPLLSTKPESVGPKSKHNRSRDTISHINEKTDKEEVCFATYLNFC